MSKIVTYLQGKKGLLLQAVALVTAILGLTDVVDIGDVEASFTGLIASLTIVARFLTNIRAKKALKSGKPDAQVLAAVTGGKVA